MRQGLGRARQAMRTENEQGMTLVELLVYMILLGLVMAIIGSLMINTVKKQAEVVRISESNNTAQSIASSIDHAVSNASSFRLRTDVNGNQLLVAKTRSTLAGPDEVNQARCVGYFYDAATQKMHSISVPLPAAHSENKTREADVAGFGSARSWSVLAIGIVPASAVAPARVFTQGADASKVSLEFSIATIPGRPAVSVRTTTSVRGSGLIDNTGVCWNA